jgi:crotonobetaine/carnitine-CoA ligase
VPPTQPSAAGRHSGRFPAPAAETAALRGATPDGAAEAALLYTSGTTGRPKGCIVTNEYFRIWGTWYASRAGVIHLREGQ